MTRLECVVARAYQPRSRIRVSFPLSLLRIRSRHFFSLTRTLHRVTADFYAVGDKKKCVYSCAKLLRERTTLRRRSETTTRTRARVALFFFPPSRASLAYRRMDRHWL